MSAEVSDSGELPIVDEPVFRDTEEGTSPDDEKSGRAIFAALGLAAVVSTGAGWLGWNQFFRDDPLPPPEDAIVGESQVDCSQMLRNFRPETAQEKAVLLGKPVTFVGRSPSNALKTYYDNRNAMLAHECLDISHATKDDLTGRLFAFTVENLPVDGAPDTFQIIVTIDQTGTAD